MSNDDINFYTKVIHSGQKPEEITGAVMPPIFATSTYAHKSLGKNSGYEYSRTHNPTRSSLEAMVAKLESGYGGLAFASGMAAIAAVLELCHAKSHIVVNEDIYGGTWRYLEQIKKISSDLEISYVDMRNLDEVAAVLRPETKMIWLETPSNPMMRITDIAAVSALAHRHDTLVVVDNTFATPYLQQPIKLGADIVVHSVTKYLNGHSDVIGGVVISATEQLHTKLAFIQNTVGAILSPFDSFLVLRGIKTLAVRMAQHCSSAMILAQWLQQQSGVNKVYYPGLENHAQLAISKKQMQHGFGGIITIECTNFSVAKQLLDKCRIFTLAESLGGVESLIEHPASMTHASLPQSHREKLGISDSLVRISVGIEDCSDLQKDLLQALKS